MDQNTEKKLEDVVKAIDKKLMKKYDLKVHNPENIETGKVLYVSNHHHLFDPFFVGYAIAKENIPLHHMAKESLFKMPFVKDIMNKYGAIKTYRPKKNSLRNSKEKIREMQEQISDYLSRDEGIYFAYAGTRTKNYDISEYSKNLEKELAKTGVLSMAMKDHKEDLKVQPVFVEIYEKDSGDIFFKGIKTLVGLNKSKNKIGADVMFGEPIDVKDFIYSGNKKRNKKELIYQAIDDIFDMREKVREDLDDEPGRNPLELYGF